MRIASGLSEDYTMQTSNTQHLIYIPDHMIETSDTIVDLTSSDITSRPYEKPTFVDLGEISGKTGFLGYTPNGATSCTPLGS